MLKNSVLASLLLGSSTLAFAQVNQIYFDDDSAFRKAKNLYFTETYLAANYEFDRILDHQTVSENSIEATEYFAALTALINHQPGGEERFLAFLEQYPKSIYATYGSWELGNFYLERGDFDKAYQYLGNKNLSEIPERKRGEYQFKLGYLHLMKGNLDTALAYLEPLTNSDKYIDEATFYVGHIFYEKGDYPNALKYFNLLRTENPAYESKVLPYIVQINFNNGEYHKAIENGRYLLSLQQSSFMQSEISKIIGESYFRLKNYKEAIPYLAQYEGKMSYADYYQLGYAYYEQKDYAKAVSYFNKIINQKDAWAQIAYYQLGNAYLKTNQKKEALAAYQAAAEMSFDKSLKEQAAYHYAKLSYDIGNPYESPIIVLQNFSASYPQSRYKNEINRFLAETLLSNGDYKNAILTLAKIKTKNTQELEAEQLANYLYGTALFKESKINQAEHYFKTAAQNNTRPNIAQKSYFWLGEIAYQKGLYQEATNYFEKFKTYNATVEESKQIDYQLGYAYLKLKQFSKAERSFKDYLATNPSGEMKNDAKLRLADSYVGAKNNEAAIELYSEVAKSNHQNADEAAYNRALVLGIKGDASAKANALEKFIINYPVSRFIESAKLELADAYLQLKSYNKAILVLDDIIKTTLKSETLAQVHLRKGLIYYNQGNNDMALSEFKIVVETSPRSNVAYQAIENSKRIYIDKGDYRGFENWAKTIDFYNLNTSEIENLAYDEAMRRFDAKDYKNAIPLLKNFVAQYPESNHFSAANYALGESYYQTSDYSNATPYLSESAKYDTENKADALLRLAQIYISQNKDTEALLTLEDLYKISDNTAYRSYAEIKLMQIYNRNGNHSKALAMAEKVIKNEKNEKFVRQEAELIKAKSLLNRGDTNAAKEAYKNLETADSNAVKAEALYYKAYFLNQEKNYKKSNEVIFDLASKYAEQQHWGSQSLVLMAENYYKLGDLYQANYTLKTVIANYQDFPEVIEKAKKLQKIINKK